MILFFRKKKEFKKFNSVPICIFQTKKHLIYLLSLYWEMLVLFFSLVWCISLLNVSKSSWKFSHSLPTSAPVYVQNFSSFECFWPEIDFWGGEALTEHSYQFVLLVEDCWVLNIVAISPNENEKLASNDYIVRLETNNMDWRSSFWAVQSKKSYFTSHPKVQNHSLYAEGRRQY